MFKKLILGPEPVDEEYPTLREEAARIGTLPRYSLYFGTAFKDEMPVILSLDNPSGHVIIYSKQPFPFRTIKKARRTFRFWQERVPVEIVHVSASDWNTDHGWQTLHALRKWAKKGNRTVLLIEDIEQAFGYRESGQDIQWLLENGARNNLLVVAQSKRELPREWNQLFRTTIYQTQKGNYSTRRGREKIMFFVPKI